jgi:hypothetical protein
VSLEVGAPVFVVVPELTETISGEDGEPVLPDTAIGADDDDPAPPGPIV